jgi:serine/threonine protein kinase
VAIKVIRSKGIAYPESASAKEAARLFEREAKAIVRLDHPNILPLYAYGEEMLGEQQFTYLVMPYPKRALWPPDSGFSAKLYHSHLWGDAVITQENSFAHSQHMWYARGRENREAGLM